VRQFLHGGSRGEVLEFLTCGRGVDWVAAVRKGRGSGGRSSTFAYIDFTSRNELRDGKHNKVRDEER